MFFSTQRLPVSWTSVCLALIGVAYCAVQVVPLPVSVPCPGTGCRLIQEFTIQGVSLWWAGVAYFGIMALVCLRRLRAFAYALAAVALCVDAVLLCIMLMTVTCIPCLGAGLLMALLYFSLRRHTANKMQPSPGPSVILMAWCGLFVAALASAGTEHMEPWQLAGPENAERRVYFSPSCPACRDAVTVFAGNAAFIPVAENEGDYAAIHAMANALAEGKTLVEALDAATGQNNLSLPSFPGDIVFRLNLMRNKAQLLRLGFDQIPLIMINGMPQAMRPNTAAPATEAHGAAAYGGAGNGSSSPAALPPELAAPVASCGDQNAEPCDPPQPAAP